jgi:hypothetical protein
VLEHMAWNYKLSCKKLKSCTMPIPCLRETGLHLVNPLRTPLIASLTRTTRKPDGPALQNTRIPQNPHKIRKKKKKQILPPCPTQTLEPEKTDQTQRLQKVYSLPEGDLATPVKSAANPMTGRKKIKAKYYQKPSPSQLDPQSRNAPSPAPQPQLAQTDKAWHPPTSETLTPRRGVDLIRSADSAPAKTGQIRPPTITSETQPPRRAAFDFVRSADSAPAKTDQIRPTITSETQPPRRAPLDFTRSADSAPAKTDQIRLPTITSETQPPRRGAFDFTRSADSAPAKTDQIRPPSLAKPNHHGETSLISLGRQTRRPQRRVRFVPPPSSVKPNHHGETSLTSVGRQTQRPQRRIRLAPHHH